VRAIPRAFTLTLPSPTGELYRNHRTWTYVILSASEESLFSDVREERSFGYRLRMTLSNGLPGRTEVSAAKL
jgi:hypothetical protein